MSRNRFSFIVPAAATALAAFSLNAGATTQPVFFNVLTSSATLATPFLGGDTLRLDSLVTTEVGPLSQSVNFTVGPGVGSLIGEAAWEISTATGPGPRLTGVNIDVLDSGNSVVASDTFLGVLGGFAISSLAGSIGPGSYTLLATGTGVRESSLDITLSFVDVIPEPQTYAMMLAGLSLLGLVVARRR